MTEQSKVHATSPTPDNLDEKVVAGFGEEWSAFDQSGVSAREEQENFDAYFSIFPFEDLRTDAEGFDMGCGSGRWAAHVCARVGLLHCIDPASAALDVARRRLAGSANVRFHRASTQDAPLAEASQDFGYALGVLHHIPDTARALADCVAKLKPGAPFLLYLYYQLDGRPLWYQALWHGAEIVRAGVARTPFVVRSVLANAIAALVYWPLARFAALAERFRIDVHDFPLSAYRSRSFYTMRTDALDRFGTRLEQRFTRDGMESMMRGAGLDHIVFSDSAPFWIACGRRSAAC
jgi:SAM-dependent methyltransferase